MATRYKINFQNGHPINVKAYVGETGCSLSVHFEYRALGGLLELWRAVYEKVQGVMVKAGRTQKVFGAFKILCYVSDSSQIQIENDRDLLNALNKHGFDQEFTRAPFIITIKFVHDYDEIYLGSILEFLIMGTVTADNILTCWGKHPTHLLFPDPRAEVYVDVQKIFNDSEEEIKQNKKFKRRVKAQEQKYKRWFESQPEDSKKIILKRSQ